MFLIIVNKYEKVKRKIRENKKHEIGRNNKHYKTFI